MYWLNGVPEKKLSLGGRVFLFGDGFFTTARLCNGTIELLDWHLDRLIIASQRLLFDNLDFTVLRREINIASKYARNGVIQIMILRANSGNLGYSFKKNVEPIRIIFYSATRDYNSWHRDGVRLIQSSIRISRNPLLAGIKHLNRLEQIMICQNHLISQGIADEVLVLDTEGYLVECCTANIFWRVGYNVFTPNLIYAGVSGVMRRWVLKLLPKLGYNIQEVITTPEVLQKADEVFISNSLLPIVSVHSIGRHKYMDRSLYNLLFSYYMQL